jgi:hypothetical protein
MKKADRTDDFLNLLASVLHNILVKTEPLIGSGQRLTDGNSFPTRAALMDRD